MCEPPFHRALGWLGLEEVEEEKEKEQEKMNEMPPFGLWQSEKGCFPTIYDWIFKRVQAHNGAH